MESFDVAGKGFMFEMLMQPVGASCLLAIIAVLVGNGFLTVLKVEKNIAAAYLSGWVLIWAMIQVVSVPMILLRTPFTPVFWIITGMVAVFGFYGMYTCRRIRFTLPKYTWLEWTGLGVTVVCMAVLLLVNLTTQHTDGDDSRFVVNAVDILRTNTMFLTNPATGERLDIWQGELIKDVTAPWAVFIAWCAKLTGTHATVMAHTVLPLILFLAVFSVWWLLSETFFKREVFYRCLFMDVLILVTVYGGFSVYSEEVFMLSRIWQGKAVVAAFGVPAAYLIGDWIYRENSRSSYVLSLLLNLAMCLMSGMGLIIGAMIFGSLGLVYGMVKKNWKMSLLLWGSCIPNIVYYAINLSLG